MKPKVNPYLALAIGVISISTSAILVKFSTAPSGVIAFYRLFFSVLLMLPIFLLKYTKELRHITRRDWIFSIVAGVFLAFHFILWFESLNYTSVTSSTVLVTLQPLFAFVGTYFVFKEKITYRTILCGLTAIGGSFIISWGDFQISGSALYGDLLAILACILVTVYLMFGQSVRKRVSLITYTFIVYSISSITLFGYVLVLKQPFVNYPSSDWVYFILLALFPTLLGHSLFNWSVKWLSTSTISMAVLMEPVGASILAYYLLNENIMLSQIMGGLIIIVSLVFFMFEGIEVKTKLKLKTEKDKSMETLK